MNSKVIQFMPQSNNLISINFSYFFNEIVANEVLSIKIFIKIENGINFVYL
jgi:hypothetical protein